MKRMSFRTNFPFVFFVFHHQICQIFDRFDYSWISQLLVVHRSNEPLEDVPGCFNAAVDIAKFIPATEKSVLKLPSWFCR